MMLELNTPQVQWSCANCTAPILTEARMTHQVSDNGKSSVTTMTLTPETSCVFCRLLWEIGEKCGSIGKWEASCFVSIRHFPTIVSLNSGGFKRQKRISLFNVQDKYNPWELGGKQISGDTGSSAAVHFAKEMLRKCRQSHNSGCNESIEFVPSRLIEISDPGGGKVRLLERSHLRQVKSLQYLCLSHCWGSSRIFTTNTTNYQALKVSIEVQSLPKTFRDAILTTKELGFAYVWLDSLCIIQDDLEDWRKESAQMFQIYSNATLTLAALRGFCCEDGMFVQPIPEYGDRNIIMMDRDTTHQLHVGFRTLLAHPLGRFVEQDGMPLMNRAWFYQERLLSKRILYFGPSELVWECREETCCECGCISNASNDWTEGYTIPIAFFHQALSDARTAPLNLTGPLWRRIIEEYTRMNLTFTKDIFPALSGLASLFSQSDGHDYLAGLWKTSLAADLLWRTKVDTRTRTEFAVRPSSWRAPTWSWASVCRPVVYDLGPLRSDETAAPFELLKAHIVQSGSDLMGEMSSATITIRGRLSQVLVQRQSRACFLLRNEKRVFGTLSADYDFWSELGREKSPNEFLEASALLIAVNSASQQVGLANFWYLVLTWSRTSRGKYERIGRAEALQPLAADVLYEDEAEVAIDIT